ncbi:hypothetical protein [Psychroserpens mesophilus]|uniref:hypothetical protein n=1 Tax=Psychroserpens mesophilus TaxID=325473 RepID=UPI003F49A2FF
MKLFLKKISALFIVFVALAMLMSFGSLYFLRHSSFYKSSFLVNQVPQDNFDYVILGASDGLTTLNTKVIDSVLSIEGLNLSMDDTSLSSHYLMLQHFLAEGKQTKYCILVSSASGFDTYTNTLNNNDYRFLMYTNRAYVTEYYKQFTDTRANILYYSKWMPQLGVSYYNAELFYPSLMSLLKPEKRNHFDDKGNFTYPVLNKTNQEITEFKAVSVEFSNPYVARIKTLCNENNIELICYFPPHESKKAIIKSSEYHFINHSSTLTNTAYFYDEIHVNHVGRQLSSLNFAETFRTYKTND